MLLIETQYALPISTLALASSHQGLCLEANENHQKGGYRQRTRIAGANGVEVLSIPLQKGKNEQLNIKQVKIAYNEPWQRQHWSALRSAYARAPYFEHFEGSIERFYQKEYELLWDFNLELSRTLIKLMRLPIALSESTSFEPIIKEQRPANDARQLMKPNDTSFEESITVKAYPQVFEEKYGFIPHLGAFDLLFCVGTQAGDYLHK